MICVCVCVSVFVTLASWASRVLLSSPTLKTSMMMTKKIETRSHNDVQNQDHHQQPSDHGPQLLDRGPVLSYARLPHSERVPQLAHLKDGIVG